MNNCSHIKFYASNSFYWTTGHKTKPRPQQATSLISCLLNSCRQYRGYMVKLRRTERAKELLYWISPLQWQLFHRHTAETLSRQPQNKLTSLFSGSITLYLWAWKFTSFQETIQKFASFSPANLDILNMSIRTFIDPCYISFSKVFVIVSLLLFFNQTTTL